MPEGKGCSPCPPATGARLHQLGLRGALALFYLVVLQSLLVFLVDRPSPRLGLTGPRTRRHRGGTAVIISVLWITMMCLWLFQLFNQDRGLPLRLSVIGLPGLE
ncbi:MAG: hypothetical protein GY719_12415 [bacterium]|nr:hypothetical protein [bacterium]